jgi:hypothetical protein
VRQRRPITASLDHHPLSSIPALAREAARESFERALAEQERGTPEETE